MLSTGFTCRRLAVCSWSRHLHLHRIHQVHGADEQTCRRLAVDRPAHSNPAVSKAASEAIRQLTTTAPMTLLESAIGLIVAQDRSLHTAALAAVDLVLPAPSNSQARPSEWDGFCEAAERRSWLQGQLASLASSESS